MLGILSAATINWTRKDSSAVLALKLVGLATGAYCAVHSDARGAWIAIPVLTFIWTHYYLRGYRGAKYVAVAALLFVAVAGYQLVPQVRNRIAVTQAEVVSVFTGHLNTSIGLRLQIWNAALHLIRDNPIAGVGPAGLPDALRAFHERGGIDDFALELAIGEMHNEILAHTTRFGIFGLLSILAIYLVPLTLFAAATSSSDHVKRNAGVMGVLFAVGYFIYGLTLETFAMKPFATFYAMTVACLLAIARQSVPQMAGSTNFGADTQRGLA
jgi:O-antigen ligase